MWGMKCETLPDLKNKPDDVPGHIERKSSLQTRRMRKTLRAFRCAGLANDARGKLWSAWSWIEIAPSDTQTRELERFQC